MMNNEFPLIELTGEALRENAVSLLGNEYSIEKEKQLLDCFFENERAITDWRSRCGNAFNILEKFNTILVFHGVESLYDQSNPALNGHRIYYCNSGDIYNQTIIWMSSENTFYIGDWGSLLEYLEMEYEKAQEYEDDEDIEALDDEDENDEYDEDDDYE